MVRVVMIHSVRYCEEFIRRFREGGGRRELRGIVRHWVHRSVDNPNEVMVTLELESRAGAGVRLAAGEQIPAWIERAGVDVYPAVFIGEVVTSSTNTAPWTPRRAGRSL